MMSIFTSCRARRLGSSVQTGRARPRCSGRWRGLSPSPRAQSIWAGAICLATYLGLNPPGFAAQVVALAFGLAAATLFPTLMMGIFSKRMNAAGATWGMIAGLVVTCLYLFTYLGWFFIPGTNMLENTAANYLFGIPPTHFGPIGALINFAVAYGVSSVTAAPPQHIQDLVESVRIPRGAGAALNK